MQKGRVWSLSTDSKRVKWLTMSTAEHKIRTESVTSDEQSGERNRLFVHTLNVAPLLSAYAQDPRRTAGKDRPQWGQNRCSRRLSR